MGQVVVDSSVWIKFFRDEDPSLVDQVEALILEDKVASCGIVEAELLSESSNAERKLIETRLNSLECRDLNRSDFRNAASLYRDMRSRGKTLNLSDLLIAAFCMQHNFALLTLDSDFSSIPGLSRLRPNIP